MLQCLNNQLFDIDLYRTIFVFLRLKKFFIITFNHFATITFVKMFAKLVIP